MKRLDMLLFIRHEGRIHKGKACREKKRGKEGGGGSHINTRVVYLLLLSIYTQCQSPHAHRPRPTAGSPPCNRTSRSERVGVGGKTNEPLAIGLHPSSTRSSARMRLAMLAVCLWLRRACFAGGPMSGIADVGDSMLPMFAEAGERYAMPVSSSSLAASLESSYDNPSPSR